MAKSTKLEEVVDALAMTGDFRFYFLDRRTGEIEMIGEEEWRAAENDDLITQYPEWQRELILKAKEIQSSDQFAELPGKFEINSYEIMERFCHDFPDPRVSHRLSVAIRGTGAFRRFKDAIFDLGIEDEWNRFENQALEEIAIEWLEAEGIQFTRGDEIELSSEM